MWNAATEQHKVDLVRVSYFGAEHAKEKIHAEMDIIRTMLHQGRKDLLEESQKHARLEAKLEKVKLAYSINDERRI